jgi:hypothetical protein
MNYTEAYVIQQGYKFEKAKTHDKARAFQLWLQIALATQPQHRDQITKLWEQGRAEGRAR